MNDQSGFLEELADIEEKLLEELRSVRRNARLLLKSPVPEGTAVPAIVQLDVWKFAVGRLPFWYSHLM